MVRGALLGLALMLAAIVLTPLPALDSAGVAAFLAIFVVAAFASTVALGPCAARVSAPGPGVLPGISREDQHRRGAFRRQHAPDTPGRPGRPRSPNLSSIGPAR